MDKANPLLPVSRETNQAKREAIKSNYKLWKEEISYNDLVDYLKTCYNTYNEYGGDLSLPREVRNSYYDRAWSFNAILEYIQRQVK